jgi:hypothetical protein
VPRCQMDPACMDEIRNQPEEHRAQVRSFSSLPRPQSSLRSLKGHGIRITQQSTQLSCPVGLACISAATGRRRPQVALLLEGGRTPERRRDRVPGAQRSTGGTGRVRGVGGGDGPLGRHDDRRRGDGGGHGGGGLRAGAGRLHLAYAPGPTSARSHRCEPSTRLPMVHLSSQPLGSSPRSADSPCECGPSVCR